jgi:hypothetical protein
MRHDYELTDETRKTLSGNVQDIADEMHVSDKHLYGILAGTKTDPFAVFEHLYASTCRADRETCHWDNKLAAHRARRKSRPSKSLVECLTDKIHSDAEATAELVDGLRDGEIDSREAERIQLAIARQRQNLDLLETHLGLRRELGNNGFPQSKAPQEVSKSLS